MRESSTPSHVQPKHLVFARTAHPHQCRDGQSAPEWIAGREREQKRTKKKTKKGTSRGTCLIDLPLDRKQQLLPSKQVPDEPPSLPFVRVIARVHLPGVPGQFLDEALLYRAESEALCLMG